MVPVAARVVVAQHGGGLARLIQHAQRQVDLHQAVQGLRHVAGALVLIHHLAETLHGGQVQAHALVIAPDVHLLTRQMVAGQVDLQLGVAGVRAGGEAADDLFQGLQRLHGRGLVAPHVGDLLIIAEALQVIGVGDVGVARVQADEAVQRADGLFILVGLVIGVGGHQLGAHGPGGIGVLLFHGAEQQGRLLVFAAIDGVAGFGVDLLHRAFDVGRLLLIAGASRDREQRQGGGERDQAAEATGRQGNAREGQGHLLGAE
ncbi:hypothetical protein AZA_90600 [Nitrospirillum viridazoti Y2]|nr:hypothetical protein AZA_90600 [Nitrospirillum amazonense Y2]